MNSEGVALADVLARIGRNVLHELQDLPDDVLNRAVGISEGNTLFALATHLVGAAEFWVLALAGGRQIARDRDAEFRASGTYGELEVRYFRWFAEVREVLSTVDDASWDQLVEPPAQFRGSVGEETMSVRASVLHAVEHSALHLGQIQLTRSLLTQASPERANA
jgi:uncharacterized damage-inducible protein DinB